MHLYSVRGYSVCSKHWCVCAIKELYMAEPLIDPRNFLPHAIREEIVRLNEIINAYQKESGKQTEQMLDLNNKMVRLTRVIAFLTIIMVIGLVVQIWLAWND